MPDYLDGGSASARIPTNSQLYFEFESAIVILYTRVVFSFDLPRGCNFPTMELISCWDFMTFFKVVVFEYSGGIVFTESEQKV